MKADVSRMIERTPRLIAWWIAAVSPWWSVGLSVAQQSSTADLPAAVRAITYVLPARYYVSLLQTIFLAGDVWGVVVPNALVLLLMAVVVLALARLATQKKLT